MSVIFVVTRRDRETERENVILVNYRHCALYVECRVIGTRRANLMIIALKTNLYDLAMVRYVQSVGSLTLTAAIV